MTRSPGLHRDRPPGGDRSRVAFTDDALRSLTRLAADLTGTPRAAVVMLDATRAHWVAPYGTARRHVPRSASLVARLLDAPNGNLVVPDARADDRLADAAPVTTAPGVRFVAAAPIEVPATLGEPPACLGALCVMDTAPRHDFGSDAQCTLSRLATLAAEAWVRLPDAPSPASASPSANASEVRTRSAREAGALDPNLLADTLEQISDAVLITSAGVIDAPDGPRITYVNAAFERMTGYAREEVLGRTPRLLQGPATDRAVLDTLRAALEREEAWSGQAVNYRKEGTPYTVEWSLAPVRDADGTVRHWCSVQRDVTARLDARRTMRQQRDALRRERDLLARIFDTSATAFVIIGADGTILRANRRAERVLGLTLSDVEGRVYDDPVWKHTTVEGDPLPPEDLPFVRVMATEAPVYDVRHGIAWPDGRRRILAVDGAPLRDPDGTIAAAVFIANDVTERTEAEAALRRRDQRLTALYHATGRLHRADTPEALARIVQHLIHDTLGYAFVAVRFVRDGALVPVAAATCAGARPMAKRAHALDGPTAEARAYRHGRTVLDRDAAGICDADAPVRAIACVPLGRFGVASIGTPGPDGLDALDAKLIDILAHNASSVFARIEREAALREARDVAEEMNRLKSTFLANMSHEIRTPLTAVIGFSEVLQDLDLDSPADTFADTIHRGGQRLMDTLDAVLNLSQLEAGMVELRSERVDATVVVHGVAASLAQQAEEAGVTVHVDTPEQPVRLVGDRSALRRVTSIIVGNAIKFTPEGGRVDVRLHPVAGGVELAVADTGIGIDPAFLPHLFEAFNQESSGTAREYEGVGLGLTIARQFVELAGGTIEAKSTKGEGATFTVHWPLAPSAA